MYCIIILMKIVVGQFVLLRYNTYCNKNMYISLSTCSSSLRLYREVYRGTSRALESYNTIVYFVRAVRRGELRSFCTYTVMSSKLAMYLHLQGCLTAVATCID